jgi:hypothetical protein
MTLAMNLTMNLGYLDAGTGSLILQTVLGGAAGLAVFLKTSGRRFFVRSKKNGAPATPAAEVTPKPAEQTTES